MNEGDDKKGAEIVDFSNVRGELLIAFLRYLASRQFRIQKMLDLDHLSDGKHCFRRGEFINLHIVSSPVFSYS